MDLRRSGRVCGGSLRRVRFADGELVQTCRWSKHVTKGHKELMKHIEKRTKRIQP